MESGPKKPPEVDAFLTVPKHPLDWYEASALINFWAVRSWDGLTEESPLGKKDYRATVRRAIDDMFRIGEGRYEFPERLVKEMVKFLVYLHFEDDGEW